MFYKEHPSPGSLTVLSVETWAADTWCPAPRRPGHDLEGRRLLTSLWEEQSGRQPCPSPSGSVHPLGASRERAGTRGAPSALEGTSPTFTHRAGALRTGDRRAHTGHGQRDKCTRKSAIFTLIPPSRHSTNNPSVVLGQAPF